MSQPLPNRLAPTPDTHRLTLVPSRSRHFLLTLWHLLSLDAPTVAALWTCFVAHSCHIRLPWTASASMFLAVWMLYATDRLLDARVPGAADLEDRHRFHHRHKNAFLTGIVCASLGLATLLPQIDPVALRLYALLASLLFAYFFLIHIQPSIANPRRLPKEFAVGIFFPAAIFIPTVARAPQLRLELAPVALLFAAVCTLNCLYLYAWEHPTTRASAHWTTRFATRRLRPLSILVLCATALVIPFALTTGHLSLALAPALSIFLLLLLDAHRHRLSSIHLRAAADLALLTPLLLFPFAR